ncbi:hypothetical protein ID866_8214 [Astraeus odoratus]|nr:hypothetical protein ID866_8214 [Astraeus odoratus]
MAPVTLLARDSLSSDGMSKGLIIAGFTLVGVLVSGVSLWLLVRYCKHRMREKRSEERGAAFLHVRGVMKAGDGPGVPARSLPNAFNRENLTASIILPDKVLTRQALGQTAASVPEAPILLLPTDPGLDTYSRSQPPISPLNLRLSRASVYSTCSQLPHLRGPGLHCRPSSFGASSTGSSHSRPVRQLFEPVLPDELPLTGLGEHLTVLESFDDGWCLVAKDNSRSRRSSLASAILGFRGKTANSVNMDLSQADIGLVPAWVFVKPMKGLTVERPVRVSSVDALQLGIPAEPSRDTVISWSNFA